MTDPTQTQVDTPERAEDDFALSQDAQLVLAIFMPTLSKAAGKRLLRDIQDAASRHIKRGAFEKAQFALRLADQISPLVDAIVPKATRPAKTKGAKKAA